MTVKHLFCRRASVELWKVFLKFGLSFFIFNKERNLMALNKKFRYHLYIYIPPIKRLKISQCLTKVGVILNPGQMGLSKHGRPNRIKL